MFVPCSLLHVNIASVDEEDLEAELEALGDELAMEEELKEEEGAVPRYFNVSFHANLPVIWKE